MRNIHLVSGGHPHGYAVLAFLLLLAIGCVRTEYVYIANKTKIIELETCLNNTNSCLNITSNLLMYCNRNVTALNNTLQGCFSDLYACRSQPIYQYNCSNTTKYSFSCADEYNVYYPETAYRCFWDVREKYQTGYYSSMAVLCQTLGLPDACACYWSMNFYAGVRASTGTASGKGG